MGGGLDQASRIADDLCRELNSCADLLVDYDDKEVHLPFEFNYTDPKERLYLLLLVLLPGRVHRHPVQFVRYHCIAH